MSQNQTQTPTETQKAAQTVEAASKSIVGALLDLGSAWAAHGLNAGKFSLENSARALEKTAKVLENMAQEIEKKNRKSDAA
jgi:hypothetical protein